jgi:dCTP deaminase
MHCVLTASCKQRIANVLLADRDILEEMRAGGIILDPFDPACVQPASYDVHLDDTVLWPKYQPSQPQPNAWREYMTLQDGVCYDPGADEQPVETLQVPYRREHARLWLPPGGVALGCTQELLQLHASAPISADIAGCSSLGRWWLFVHVTAGFIDPGWSGRLTLELYNASPWWLRIWAGMRIAQLRFYYTHVVPLRNYLDTGNYAGALTALPSAYKG